MFLQFKSKTLPDEDETSAIKVGLFVGEEREDLVDALVNPNENTNILK